MVSKKKAMVVKSNNLVEASYRLTLFETRILMICISKIESGDDVRGRIFTVTAPEIASITGIALNGAYAAMETAADRLFKREVRITNHERLQNEKDYIKAHWVQDVAFKEATGTIELCFSDIIAPYLSNLSECFTQYRISEAAKLTSTHAMRIYELLVQFRGTGYRLLEIDWIREKLDLHDKYKTTKDLRAHVIEPSVKMINERTSCHVRYAPVKKGRKIIGYKFLFEDKSIDTSEKKEKYISKKMIKGAAMPGETEAEVRARLKRQNTPAPVEEGEKPNSESISITKDDDGNWDVNSYLDNIKKIVR